MNTASLHTHSQPTAQAAQLFAFRQVTGHTHEFHPFTDNHEHLKSLELEATMLLACAYLKRNRHGLKEDEKYFFPSFPLINGKAEPGEAQTHLERVADENRQRELLSTAAGITLNFISFCSEWGLDRFEQNVVMLLLMQYSAPDFIALYGDCEFEKGRGNGMEIGTLLSLLCDGLKEQLEHRHYFSVVGRLFSNDLIAMNGSVDDTTNILDEKVFLPERLVRFILGDNNLYNSCFRFIKREKGTVNLDQVILPDAVKVEVVSCAKNYLQGRNDGSLDELDGFYGYGTGLTMLFYGPSGTGKTMLARALATRFDRTIFSLAAEDMREMPGSYDEILGTLFREAALQGAIVFLDECDDLFENSGRASRALLLEMEKARCLIIMATNKPITLDPAIERRISLKVPFGIPDAGIRRGIWQALIPDSVKLAEDVDLDDLAQRYQFSGGLIRNTLFLALTLLKQDSGSSMTLTAAVLEQAASKQVSTLGDEQQICRHINPAITIDSLPLRARQRKELKNLSAVWDNLKTRKTGLALIISATDITGGVQTAEALARECGLKLRSFDYEKITSLSEGDRMIDPVTQRKILPLDYAFAPAATEAAMTVFVDHEGIMEPMLNSAKEYMADQLMRELLTRLRKQNGLFCMVTKEIRSYRLPPEFNLLIRLEHPGEETQIRHWEQVLGGLQGDEEKELFRLVEASPLHINEIDFVVRQAGILSTIRRMDSRPSMAELEEVIAGFRKSNRIPLLFGGDE
jgi:hypothetical protein